MGACVILYLLAFRKVKRIVNKSHFILVYLNKSWVAYKETARLQKRDWNEIIENGGEVVHRVEKKLVLKLNMHLFRPTSYLTQCI